MALRELEIEEEKKENIEIVAQMPPVGRKTSIFSKSKSKTRKSVQFESSDLKGLSDNIDNETKK